MTVWVRANDKPSGNDRYHSTIAPYLDNKVTSDSGVEGVTKRKEVRQFMHNAGVVAQVIDHGLTVNGNVSNIGGFTDEEMEGGRTTELSFTFDIVTDDPERADLFACLMGDIGYEQQVAVINATDTTPDDPDANAFEYLIPITDVDGALRSLEEAGVGDFTLNRKGRTISLLNFARNEDGGFDSTSIKQVITKLKEALVKNECYDTGRQEIHKKIKSGYFDRGARRDKYKAWLTKASVGRTRPNSSQNDSEDAKAEASLMKLVSYALKSLDESIHKSLTDCLLLKARSGVYKDTPENRRLHRVGQRYGNTPTEHKQPSQKISYEEQESQRQFNKAKELLEALKKRGLNGYTISRSVKDWGVSTYIQGYNGNAPKFRISDHSVTSPHRVLNEVHFNYNSDVDKLADLALNEYQKFLEGGKVRDEIAEKQKRETQELDSYWDSIKDDFKDKVFKRIDRTYQALDKFLKDGQREKTNVFQKEISNGAYSYEWAEPVNYVGKFRYPDNHGFQKPSYDWLRWHRNGANTVRKSLTTLYLLKSFAS